MYLVTIYGSENTACSVSLLISTLPQYSFYKHEDWASSHPFTSTWPLDLNKQPAAGDPDYLIPARPGRVQHRAAASRSGPVQHRATKQVTAVSVTAPPLPVPATSYTAAASASNTKIRPQAHPSSSATPVATTPGDVACSRRSSPPTPFPSSSQPRLHGRLLAPPPLGHQSPYPDSSSSWTSAGWRGRGRLATRRRRTRGGAEAARIAAAGDGDDGRRAATGGVIRRGGRRRSGSGVRCFFF